MTYTVKRWGVVLCLLILATQVMGVESRVGIPGSTSDADTYTLVWSLNRGYMAVGDYGGPAMSAGLRFVTSVPQGATIDSCYIKFKCDYASSPSAQLRVEFQDADAPAVFSDSTDYANRTRTTAYFDFDMTGSYTAETWYRLPDGGEYFTAPFQEVVDRAGFGGTVVVYVKGRGATYSEMIFLRDYDYAASDACTLVTYYTESTPSGPVDVRISSGTIREGVIR